MLNIIVKYIWLDCFANKDLACFVMSWINITSRSVILNCCIPCWSRVVVSSNMVYISVYCTCSFHGWISSSFSENGGLIVLLLSLSFCLFVDVIRFILFCDMWSSSEKKNYVMRTKQLKLEYIEMSIMWCGVTHDWQIKKIWWAWLDDRRQHCFFGSVYDGWYCPLSHYY